MKKLALLPFFLVITLAIFAQKSELKKINKWLEKNPTDCPSLFYRAGLYYQMGKYEEALRDIEAQPASCNTFHTWGGSSYWKQCELKAKLLQLLGKDSLALLSWKEAEEVESKQGDYNDYTFMIEYGDMGDLCYRMGKYQDAFYYYYKLGEDEKDMRTARLNNVQRAILADKVLGEKYRQAMDLAALAAENEKKGNYKEAIDNYKRSSDLFSSPETSFNLGKVYLKQHKINDANFEFLMLSIGHYRFPEFGLFEAMVEEANNFKNSNLKAYAFWHYDQYPEKKRLDMLKEYGIEPSSNFEDKQSRSIAAEIARMAKARERDQQVLDEARAERAREPKKECLCDKCGGSGKLSTKSVKTWTENKFDATGHEIKSTTTTGWVYDDQMCSRCLGTGKCK